MAHFPAEPSALPKSWRGGTTHRHALPEVCRLLQLRRRSAPAPISPSRRVPLSFPSGGTPPLGDPRIPDEFSSGGEDEAGVLAWRGFGSIFSSAEIYLDLAGHGSLFVIGGHMSRSRGGRGDVALEDPGSLVPYRRRTGQRQPSTFLSWIWQGEC